MVLPFPALKPDPVTQRRLLSANAHMVFPVINTRSPMGPASSHRANRQHPAATSATMPAGAVAFETELLLPLVERFAYSPDLRFTGTRILRPFQVSRPTYSRILLSQRPREGSAYEPCKVN